MQQDAQQVAGAGMTLSTGNQERLQQLRKVSALPAQAKQVLSYWPTAPKKFNSARVRPCFAAG